MRSSWWVDAATAPSRCFARSAPPAAGLGLGLGVVVGRAVWRLFADELGVVPSSRTDWWGTGSAVTGLVLLALLVASVSTRLAARRPPAVALRAD